jgi:GTP cyclohydrolase II
MEQAVDEISAEQHCDQQADDGFRHRGSPLETAAGAGVDSHHDQEDDAEGEVNKVEHRALR